MKINAAIAPFPTMEKIVDQKSHRYRTKRGKKLFYYKTHQTLYQEGDEWCVHVWWESTNTGEVIAFPDEQSARTFMSFSSPTFSHVGF